jgi:lipopolysaccharide/colanic/teichoic acid biosynthesis glycosyltransferase
MDIDYARSATLRRDLGILVRTVRVMLNKYGAY